MLDIIIRNFTISRFNQLKHCSWIFFYAFLQFIIFITHVELRKEASEALPNIKFCEVLLTTCWVESRIRNMRRFYWICPLPTVCQLPWDFQRDKFRMRKTRYFASFFRVLLKKCLVKFSWFSLPKSSDLNKFTRCMECFSKVFNTLYRWDTCNILTNFLFPENIIL